MSRNINLGTITDDKGKLTVGYQSPTRLPRKMKKALKRRASEDILLPLIEQWLQRNGFPKEGIL